MKHFAYTSILLLVLAALAVGCQKGKVTIPQPASGLKAYPGRNAARVEFNVPADAKAGKIFYNMGAVEEFTVTDPGVVQSYTLRGLPDGENIIRVATKNAEGVFSDPKGVKVLVYGEDYLKGLSNRTLLNQTVVSSSTIELTFGDALADETELRLFYTNTSGEKDSLSLSISQKSVTVADIDLGKDYYYCSVYKPTDDFIDEYVSVKVSIPDFFKKKFWKNLWRIEGVSSESEQGKAANLIDNKDNSAWRSQDGSGPHWIVVEMQAPKLYDGFIIEQAQELIEGGFSKNYKFEASSDGSVWDVVQEGRLRAHCYRQKIAFKRSVKSRYFRITVLDSYDDASPQLAEIDLFNDSETSGENGMEMPMLVNAQPPFEGDGSDRFPAVGTGRMQRLTYWTHNDAAFISHDTVIGTFNIFSCAVWGCSSVTNGKIYQSLHLLPGKYVLNVQMGGTSHPDCTDVFGIITKAPVLPDFSNVETDQDVLGIADLDARTNSLVTIPFSLESERDVTIGVVYNTYNIYPASIWSDINITSLIVDGE